MDIQPIAHIRSSYPTKFGVPRQPGLAPTLLATVAFERAFSNPDAVRGLDGFDYVWLIWAFSHNLDADRRWSPTVRPPRLGGTRRLGVFATRSSFRPNDLALSCVRLVRVDASDPARVSLVVSGADLVDGTPIYDVKPYLPYADAHAEARGGWTDETAWPKLLEVEMPADLLDRVPARLRDGLMDVLRQDPRPAYTRTGREGRAFWVPLENVVTWFVVRDGRLRVVDVRTLSDDEYRELRRTGTVRAFDAHAEGGCER